MPPSTSTVDAPAPTPEHAPSAPADPLATLPVVGRRHPARWVGSAVVLLLLAQLVSSVAGNEFYRWPSFVEWFAEPVVLEGLLVTVQVTAASAIVSLVLGVAIALARMSASPVLSASAWAYVWFFRSVPLIVVLLFLFNITAFYPELTLGIPFGPTLAQVDLQDALTPLVIGVIGLSLAEAAYASEVVRAGILSVDHGQLEAANALGLSPARRFRRVVLPQALRSIVPSYVNLVIGLIKASSLVFYVSLLDLFGVVSTMGATFPSDIVPLLLVGTAWYVILTSVLSVVQYYVERHYARGAVRALPPRPAQRLRRALTRTARTPNARVTA